MESFAFAYKIVSYIESFQKKQSKQNESCISLLYSQFLRYLKILHTSNLIYIFSIY